MSVLGVGQRPEGCAMRLMHLSQSHAGCMHDAPCAWRLHVSVVRQRAGCAERLVPCGAEGLQSPCTERCLTYRVCLARTIRISHAHDRHATNLLQFYM